MAALVVAGKKTQTRRGFVPGEACRYIPGRIYAVQAVREGRTLGRICIKDVRLEALDALHDEDARAEGFADRDEFFAFWASLPWRREYDSTHVWRIEFALVGRSR